MSGRYKKDNYYYYYYYIVFVAMLVHEKYNTPLHCITISALCRVRGEVGAREV